MNAGTAEMKLAALAFVGGLRVRHDEQARRYGSLALVRRVVERAPIDKERRRIPPVEVEGGHDADRLKQSDQLVRRGARHAILAVTVMMTVSPDAVQPMTVRAYGLTM